MKDILSLLPDNIRAAVIISALPFMLSMGYFNYEFKKLRKTNPEICIFRNETQHLFCIDTMSKATRDIPYAQAQDRGFYARDPLKDPKEKE